MKPAVASPSAGAGAASSAIAIEDDPFAPSLDWTTLEMPKVSRPEGDSESSAAIKIDASQADDPAMLDLERTVDGSKQYRVLSHKEQGVVGKFTAQRLEEVLNGHAKKGWTLKSAVVINLPGHGGNHDELVVILER